MPDTRETISKRLTDARKRLGWTIEETARKMDFNRSHYSNWELGLRAPKYEELETAASVLGVTPAYLTGWSDGNGLDNYQVPPNILSAPSHVANLSKSTAYHATYLAERQLDSKNLISIIVDDDAMRDVVCRNDKVLIDTRQKRSGVRDLFALLVGERIWVRWIRPELDGNYTLSAEDARQYPDERLTHEQLSSMNVIGRVVRIERDR